MEITSIHRHKNHRKSITYQGPNLWNSLPCHIQKLDTAHSGYKGHVYKGQPLIRDRLAGTESLFTTLCCSLK